MPKLTKPRARTLADKIRNGAGQIRDWLRELHAGEGWLALGHESWAECLTVEFNYSSSYASRQIKAAEMAERLLPIGNFVKTLPESHFRELAALDESQQEYALRNAAETASQRKQPLTAEVIADEVATWLPDPPADETQLRQAEQEVHEGKGVSISDTLDELSERPVGSPDILDAEHGEPDEDAADEPQAAVDDEWGAIRRMVLAYHAKHGPGAIVLFTDLLEEMEISQ